MTGARALLAGLTVAMASMGLQALSGCSSGGEAMREPAPAARTSTAGPTVQVLTRQLTIPALGRERTLRVYLPPSYATEPQRRYPVIYMHDGQNLFDDATAYSGEWGVDETLDELARTHGFEAIVVGIDNGGDRRVTELNPWTNSRYGPGEGEAYTAFMVDVLKPFVDRQYRTLPDRMNTAVIGSSLGGLISDYAMHRHPQVFGKAGVFSPAYWIAPEMWTHAEQHRLPSGTRVYLYMGGGEGADMVSGAQRMQGLLDMTLPAGAYATYRLAPGAAHHESAWRVELPRALVWLFELQPRGDARTAPATVGTAGRARS